MKEVRDHIIKSSNYEAMLRKFSRLCAVHVLNNNVEEAKRYAVAREIVLEIIENYRKAEWEAIKQSKNKN